MNGPKITNQHPGNKDRVCDPKDAWFPERTIYALEGLDRANSAFDLPRLTRGQNSGNRPQCKLSDRFVLVRRRVLSTNNLWPSDQAAAPIAILCLRSVITSANITECSLSYASTIPISFDNTLAHLIASAMYNLWSLTQRNELRWSFLQSP